MALVALGVAGGHRQMRDEQTPLSHGLLPVQEIDQLKIDMDQTRRNMLNYAISSSEASYTKYQTALDDNDASFATNLKEYRALSTDPALADKLGTTWAEFEKLRDSDLLPAARRGDLPAVEKARDGRPARRDRRDRDRRADQPARADRHHRGRPGRRDGQGLRGGGQGSSEVQASFAAVSQVTGATADAARSSKEAAVLDTATATLATNAGEGDFLAALGGSPNEFSFCPHVVIDRAPYVEGDLASVPEHASNPAVRGGLVRSYAGVPLVLPTGEVLGSHCVMAPETHEFTDAELAELTRAADEVMTVIERYETPAGSLSA